MSTTKGERLAVRVTAQQKHTIESAAAVLGRTMTDFSVQALTERAEDVLAEQRVFGASREAWDRFTAQLDAPVRPSPELAELLRRPSMFDA